MLSCDPPYVPRTMPAVTSSNTDVPVNELTLTRFHASVAAVVVTRLTPAALRVADMPEMLAYVSGDPSFCDSWMSTITSENVPEIARITAWKIVPDVVAPKFRPVPAPVPVIDAVRMISDRDNPSEPCA